MRILSGQKGPTCILACFSCVSKRQAFGECIETERVRERVEDREREGEIERDRQRERERESETHTQILRCIPCTKIELNQSTRTLLRRPYYSTFRVLFWKFRLFSCANFKTAFKLDHLLLPRAPPKGYTCFSHILFHNTKELLLKVLKI